MQAILKQINTLVENVGFENTVFLLIALGLSALVYFLLRLQAKSQVKIEMVLRESQEKIDLATEHGKECERDRQSLRLELQSTKTRNEQLDNYNKQAHKELIEAKTRHNAVVESFNDTLKMLIDKV
jgi:uncharacterized protein (DUF3084 family)